MQNWTVNTSLAPYIICNVPEYVQRQQDMRDPWASRFSTATQNVLFTEQLVSRLLHCPDH